MQALLRLLPLAVLLGLLGSTATFFCSSSPTLSARSVKACRSLAMATPSIFDFEVTTSSGETTPLSTFKDAKATLIVNTASKCGFTRHYSGLQELYEKYQGKGLTVLGFPCNQFGGQEPGSDAEIQQFVKDNYGVTFPVFTKVEVNGGGEHPLFTYLKSSKAGGGADVAWNFEKFLCVDGEPTKRYGSRDDPAAIEADIVAALGA